LLCVRYFEQHITKSGSLRVDACAIGQKKFGGHCLYHHQSRKPTGVNLRYFGKNKIAYFLLLAMVACAYARTVLGKNGNNFCSCPWFKGSHSPILSPQRGLFFDS
jgi:hypothetical protein